MSTSNTVGARRRGLYGLLAGGLLTAAAATVIALPVAGVAHAECNQDVGQSIDSYLQKHRTCTSSCSKGRRPRVATATSSTTSIGIPTCA